MLTEEQKKKYIELFPDDMTISDMSNKLDSMEQNDETALFRQEFCNELVYAITAGYIEYGTNADFKNEASNDYGSFYFICIKSCETQCHHKGICP